MIARPSSVSWSRARSALRRRTYADTSPVRGTSRSQANSPSDTESQRKMYVFFFPRKVPRPPTPSILPVFWTSADSRKAVAARSAEIDARTPPPAEAHFETRLPDEEVGDGEPVELVPFSRVASRSAFSFSRIRLCMERVAHPRSTAWMRIAAARCS